jgi:hypothetical protein
VRNSVPIDKLQTRAYVTVKEAILRNFDAVPEAFVSVINTGITPAYELSFLLGIKITPFPPSADLWGPVNGPYSVMTLGPNQTAENIVTAGRSLEPHEKLRISSGSAAIFVVGKVTYKDVFGDDHFLQIKLACGGPYGPPRGNGKLSVCEDGNNSN